jgi:hypothetical protein
MDTRQKTDVFPSLADPSTPTGSCPYPKKSNLLFVPENLVLRARSEIGAHADSIFNRNDGLMECKCLIFPKSPAVKDLFRFPQ